MRLILRLVILTTLLSHFSAPNMNLEAYSYQPDSQGYAYTESTECATSCFPLAPLAALGLVVAIAALLYSNNHKSSSNHHHRPHHPHHHHGH